MFKLLIIENGSKYHLSCTESLPYSSGNAMGIWQTKNRRLVFCPTNYRLIFKIFQNNCLVLANSFSRQIHFTPCWAVYNLCSCSATLPHFKFDALESIFLLAKIDWLRQSPCLYNYKEHEQLDVSGVHWGFIYYSFILTCSNSVQFENKTSKL